MDMERFSKIRLLVSDFDGVMTDNRVLVGGDGMESVFCNRSDGLGIEMLKKSGVETIVLSKEKNPVVAVRCKKLKIRCTQAVDNKYKLLEQEISERDLRFDQVCYIGNDVNDLRCINLSGIGVAVADAYPEVKKVADYVTEKKGGYGAVREVCDLILEHREL